jgi:hypothetical protein
VTDLVAAETIERGPEDLPPDPRSRENGVELSRLLALARLSAPQALEIAVAVLEEAAGRSGPDPDGVPVGPVRIGGEGQVLLGADGADPPGSLLADLAASARVRGRPASSTAERQLAELDQAVADLPVVGVPVVVRRLREAAVGIDHAAVRAELAALAGAVGGRAAPAVGGGPAGGGPAGAVPGAPAGRAPRARSRTARRRIGAWLLSVLVLASVVLVEVAVLRDKIATDVGLLLDAGRGGSRPSAAATRDGLPVEPPAPAAAGTVRGLDLRPLGPCAAGAPCAVRLLVRLDPRADPQVVTWSYRVVDRCTGAGDTVPGGTVTVPPNGEQAAVVATVALPAVQGVAVMAVTGSPAAAASRPLLVGSCLPEGQAK